MTFQEKSAIVMTGALLLVYGSYFWVVLRWMSVSPVDEIAYQPLMIVAIVPLVLLATLSHIVLAIINPKEARAYDERDRAITIRAEQISGYVLAVGVFVGLVLAMGEIPHFYIANSLLLAWVLAEITDRVTKIVLYRRGA
ncbi:MAG TPA: hypothetical protein VFZ15_10745 [Acidimicrobiia bacterium]|nr:hypothetical protein [Acidimicrobiia bacterium]